MLLHRRLGGVIVSSPVMVDISDAELGGIISASVPSFEVRR